jgi:hypothetical protein
MKHFNETDVVNNGAGLERIAADRDDLIDDPPAWMKHGLQETASGYGKRLNSGLKISFCGRVYRIYVTIFSNSGTAWFKTRGRRIIVS